MINTKHLFTLVCLLLTVGLSGQCYVNEFPFDGEDDDRFGDRLVTDSLKTVVAAWRDDHSGLVEAGSVYLYDENNNFVNKITASDAGNFDRFGIDVDSYVSPTMNRFIVGAHNEDTAAPNAGAAYIYDWNGSSWDEYKVIPSDGADTDFFGFRVTIFEDTAVVGAPLHDQNGNWSGAAYVYQFNGTSWIETQKLLPSHFDDDDRFGTDVSLYDGRLLIGAKEHTHAPWPFPAGSGVTFEFEWNGTQWVEIQEFIPATIGVGAEFGVSIAQDGNRVLIGAPEEGSGIAYMYDIDNNNNWNETKIQASGLSFSDAFGDDVAMHGNQIISGSAYAVRADKFDWNGTQWVQTNYGSPVINADFGSAVGVYKHRVVIGAAYDNIGFDDTGSVFFYDQDQFFVDNDGDGYGHSDHYIYACSMPATGYIDNNLDCDDSDPNITTVGSPCVAANPCEINATVQPDCSCAGTMQIPVNVFNNTLGNNLWNQAENWSLAVIPDYCHDVIIPNGYTCNILAGESGACYKINVEADANFNMDPSSTFEAIVE